MAKRGREPMYKTIFAVYHKPQSECQFFEVQEKEGYYLARCRVLERYLTTDQVIKCENYWRTCPFRRIGEQMLEED
ncbi:MAG: hypothetical protein F7C34_02045 [Desulfurococcales archaeon]|nr:hypothetical protein [Desulfurococcales archaeon]